MRSFGCVFLRSSEAVEKENSHGKAFMTSSMALEKGMLCVVSKEFLPFYEGRDSLKFGIYFVPFVVQGTVGLHDWFDNPHRDTRCISLQALEGLPIKIISDAQVIQEMFVKIFEKAMHRKLRNQLRAEIVAAGDKSDEKLMELFTKQPHEIKRSST